MATSNSSKTTSPGNVNEKHEFKSKGFFIPMAIVELVQEEDKNKRISIKQAWLLTIIDNLVSCRGQGCFASNEYLAKQVCLEKRQLQYTLKKLIMKKLIIVKKGEKGERVLETLWSRVVENLIDEVKKGGAKNCISTPEGVHKAAPQPMHKVASPPMHKVAPISMSIPYGNEEGSIEEEPPISPLTARQRQSRASPSTGEASLGGKIKEDPIFQTLSQKLFQALVSGGKTGASTKNLSLWPRSLQELCQIELVPIEDVSKVLDWYCKNLNHQFIPRIVSTKTFKEKFFQIKDVMGRNTKPESFAAPSAPLTPKGERIVQDLLTLPWHRKAKATISDAFRVSHNFLSLFRDGMTLLYQKDKDLVNRLAGYYTEVLPDIENFLEGHFRNAWEKTKNWESWNGSLSKYILSQDSQTFKDWCYKICMGYCGQEEALELCFKEMGWNYDD